MSAHFFKITFILVIALLLSSCIQDPESGAIPTVEEVAARKNLPTVPQAEKYCYDQGGHYEDWTDEDGSVNTFCILPEGYGCDPVKFYIGSCSLVEL